MRITEPQMFRAVVIAGIGMLAVILLAALLGPLAGAILLGLEALVAAGYLVQRLRAARANQPGRSQGADPSPPPGEEGGAAPPSSR